MVIKIIGIVSAICIMQLSLLAMQSPNDPLFHFISSSYWAVIMRLILTAALLVVAFKSRFTYKISRPVAGLGGGLLIALGVLGIASQAVFYSFSGYMKALDFVLMVELGVAFVLAAASYSSARVPLSFSTVPLRRNITQPLGAQKASTKLASINQASQQAVSAKTT